MTKTLTPKELQQISGDLSDKAFIELAYYTKLFLYVNKTTGELYLEPCGVLGVEPIAELWHKDFYTKQYFNKRKKYFLDRIEKRPFQKARECSQYAKTITNKLIERQEKIFMGLEFFNGYSSAYNDFINEPMKWTNLRIIKDNFRKLEKQKLYNQYYERYFAYIQFYEDLKKDKERNKK